MCRSRSKINGNIDKVGEESLRSYYECVIYVLFTYNVTLCNLPYNLFIPLMCVQRLKPENPRLVRI